MPKLDLEAIKARVAAATPAPWYSNDEGNYVIDVLLSCARYLKENRDAEFIAHARSDIPALVAEVERLYALEQRLGPVTVGALMADPDGKKVTVSLVLLPD